MADNPYTDLRDAVAARIAAQVTDLEAADIVPYNGQSFELMAQEKALSGARVYLRIDERQQPDDAPRAADALDMQVHCIVCAGSMQGRGSAAESGEQLCWDVRAAVLEQLLSLDWLRHPMRYTNGVVEFQSATAYIASERFRVQAQLSAWSAA